MRYVPIASVLTVRLKPVARLVAVIAAPETGDFDDPRTTPVRSADELRACPKVGRGADKTRKPRRLITLIEFLNIESPRKLQSMATDHCTWFLGVALRRVARLPLACWQTTEPADTLRDCLWLVFLL